MQHQDFTKFQLLKPRLLEVVDTMLAEDIAKLMAIIPLEENVTVSEPIVKGDDLHVVILMNVILLVLFECKRLISMMLD